MKDNPLKDKSYSFAINVVNICQKLTLSKKEFVLSKQLLRSGTSIGALVRESEFAQSRADFISKLSISLKEANETIYWINLMFDTGYINKENFDILNTKCLELIKILVSIIKTSKSKNNS